MKKICVQGLGFVGSAMAIAIASSNKNISVIGLEKNNLKGERIVNKINKKILPFKTNDRSLINKFNLSDVFEAMSKNDSNIVFQEILRTGKNNSRIIFWNNLIKRDIPANLRSNFIRYKEKEKELSVFEKFKYYEKFYIYKLIK